MSFCSDVSSIREDSSIKEEIVAGLSHWCLSGIENKAKFLDRNIASDYILDAYTQKADRLNLSNLQIGPDLPLVLQHLSLRFLHLANTGVTEVPLLPRECEIVVQQAMTQESLSQEEQEGSDDKCRRWLKQSKEIEHFLLFEGIEQKLRCLLQ